MKRVFHEPVRRSAYYFSLKNNYIRRNGQLNRFSPKSATFVALVDFGAIH